MSKKKKEMKSFKLEKREDFIIYLNEIIGRTIKCIDSHTRSLKKLEKYILKIKQNNPHYSSDEIKIDYLQYNEFLSLLSHSECYLLNLIGDNQKISISYNKFRDIIKKRQSKGSLDFEILELDEKVKDILLNLNKLRNWQNHVPESLLTSEIEFINKGLLYSHNINPIEINFFNYCTLEYIEDLYKSSSRLNEDFRIILQSMKKDYSKLIGESVRIIKKYHDKPVTINSATEAVKLSASIQGLK